MIVVIMASVLHKRIERNEICEPEENSNAFFCVAGLIKFVISLIRDYGDFLEGIEWDFFN